MRYFPSASQAVSQAIAPKNLYLKGSYAEYLRIPATGEFAALPASLDVVHAAALPMAGMTALGALDTAALAKGAVLLIVGSTGGIGSFAIQMAARLGAHVIATARTEDQEYLRSLGAAETVDYTQGDVVEAVLDVVSGAAALGHIAQVLRPGTHSCFSRIRHIQYLQRDDLTLQTTRCIRAGRQRACPSGSSRRCGLGGVTSAMPQWCAASWSVQLCSSVVLQRQQ